MSTSVMLGSPRTSAICASVSITTDDFRASSTECGWARNCARRCTSVTEPAIGSSISAQSRAESPPPTTTTGSPAYVDGSGTKWARPRPRYSPPAGSGRGVNVPMPPVMTMARHSMRMPPEVVTAKPPSPRSSAIACWPSRYSGSCCAACATSWSTRSRPLMAGKPATSKIAFSGYMAVICPPGSSSESSTIVDSVRTPA